MFKKNELKVKYHLTKGPKFERIYKDQPPFFIKYTLEPNQTNINLILIRKIISTEINLYNIAEIRFKNQAKKGFVKITNKTSFPINFKEIELQIQLKEQEPQEIKELETISKNLEAKIKEFDEIKIKIKNAFDKEKIDLYFLYSFPLEETKGTDPNSIIAYHLEIAKIVDLFKNSQKDFNAIFQSATVQRLREAIREEPKILHISCHGSNPDNGYALKFEDHGDKRDVPEKELDDILYNLKDKLKNIDLVFLSSCYSQVAGELFLKYGVKNVIYIKKNCEVSNKASLVFANSFYQKLIDLNNIKEAFDSTIDELYEQEKEKNKFKCCCKAHKKHKVSCCLYDEKDRKIIHDEFSGKNCKCNLEEFCFHYKECSLVNSIKIWNKKNPKEISIEKIDEKIVKICCGCFKDKEDKHRIGESFKFKYQAQNEQCEEIIIFGDNKKGKFKMNKNCIVVTDKEMFKDIILMQIERRDKVKEIYDIIEDSNSKIHYIIIYGDTGVGKINFAKSVCAYLFERNVINKFFTKRARLIDTVKEEIENKINKKQDEKNADAKYVFIIEIDYELETPINLVNEIINENSISDPRFYFFILLRTKMDKIEIEQEKAKLIHLDNLSEPKAIQLILELRNTYEFEKDYLTEEELKKLIKLINNSRKEMLPLMKLIEHHDNFDDLIKEVKEIQNNKKYAKSEINTIMETEAGEIIFLLYIMNKGLSPSILKLFDPDFEKIIQGSKAKNFVYQMNHINWRISKSKINIDDILPYLSLDKRKNLVKKGLEICAKLLFHYIKKLRRNNQYNYFKALDIEYYCDYFFEKNGFWKSFNIKKYESCFYKGANPNFADYEKVVKNNELKLEDIKENIYNLFEVNNETVNELYSSNETIKEYIEQIIIMLPRLFIKNKPEARIILEKLQNILKKLKNIDIKNILRIKLFSLFLQEIYEINYDDFDALDKEAKAYAYFINGLRMNQFISFHESNNKAKKMKLNNQIDRVKKSYEKAIKFFVNNTMKAYCYYQLGNLEYDQKHYEEAEKKYNKGKSFLDIDNFIKGLLNLKLAKIIIDNIPNKIHNKKKFNDIIEDIIDMDDILFINEAKELQKEIEERLLPDIVMLNSNPLLKGENISFNDKIQAAPNNQYYLMDKIFNRNDINTNLIIKYEVLNEDNLRDAFSGKGKILIIQSDDFDDDGNLFLESNIGKSYSLPKTYFSKINKINYDILILCFINSGQLIDKFENKVKYLITFDASCVPIFKDIGNKSLLEYNKLSIEFLEHFIVNITKTEVKSAFEKAYSTFKCSFNNFCQQKANFKGYQKTNYITLTINNKGRVKKNESILNESGIKNIQFTPYPLLSEINLKFSFSSNYTNDISHIIKSIMSSYEIYYFYDIHDNKKKIIEINIFSINDKEIYINDNICLTAKQLVGFEVMRFFFRHHEYFNSLLFRYFQNAKKYMLNLDKLKKKSEEYSSGLGLIIINMTKKNKNKNFKTIPGFVYIYLSKEPMSNPAINVEIEGISFNNEISNLSNETPGKKKKNKKKKKFNSNYQKNKIKNWDNNSNNTKLNNKSTKNLYNSYSHMSEQKMKFYEDETSGFTIYDHEEDEDSDNIDNYLSEDEK